MIQFRGFKPEAEERIARMMGYSGDMNGFATYLAQNPEKQDMMNQYRNSAIQMLKGGVVPKNKKNYNDGGVATGADAVADDIEYLQTQGLDTMDRSGGIADFTTNMAYNPALPIGGSVTAQGIGLQNQQFIPTSSGQVSGNITAGTSQAGTYTATDPRRTGASTYNASQVTGAMARQLRGVSGETSGATFFNQRTGRVELLPQASVDAAQQTTTMTSGLRAAQGTGIMMNNPTQRQIEQGEMISGAAADATKAAQFTEQIQAAQATPTKQATVAGQLENLMQDFENGETPAWAAGAMRAAMGNLSARGLGASSIAGQAVVQAAMESALPIAQADAATRAAFEAQNLSNRQERAMLAAQQRAAFIGMEFDQQFQARVMNAAKVSDIANMNFTAEQQIALENSRIANTMQLQNLNNKQALVMAEAAALSQLDMANLSNRQQAAVMNAQNFLAVDMKNLDNRQQAAMFKAQAMQQALFTDQAAANAAKQFNATSQMQTDQFFANLQAQTSQFNAAQRNAQSQFNAGQVNAQSRFNAELKNQRQQFNAQNRLVIDQNNVQWRREVATANTAAINRANELNAAAILDMGQTAYNNLWQYYSDSMEYAWQSAENERDRVNKLAQIKLQGDNAADITELKNDYASSVAFGNMIGTFLTGGFKGFGDLFN